MQRYLMAMIESFYSTALYREIAHVWGGIAGMYLFLAVFICCLPGIYNMYGYQPWMDSVFSQQTDYHGLLARLPNMTVTNGVLAIDHPSPYAVRDPKTQQPLIIYDLKNELASTAAFPHGVIIKNTSIIFKSKNGDLNQYFTNENHNFSFNAKTATKMYEQRWAWLLAVVFPLMVIGTWIGRTCMALILAVFTVLFAMGAKADLTYKQCIPLTQVAMTPALILSSILEALNFQHPILLGTYVVMTLGYIMFAVISNR